MNTRSRAKTLALSALAGGALCTLLDQVHVRTSTLAYPHTLLFGQDFWVLPNFTLAVLAMLVLYPRIAHALGDSRDLGARPEGLREMLLAMGSLSSVYASSGVFNRHPRALLVTFVSLFALRVFREGSRSLVAAAALMALFGTAIEALLCALGLFYYRVPDVLGVPMWLPGVYLHGAFAVRALLRVVLPTETLQPTTSGGHNP